MSEITFADLLKKLRIKLRMSQAEFAEGLGISTRALQNYEKGEYVKPIKQKRIIEAAKSIKPEANSWLQQTITQTNNNANESPSDYGISPELRKCMEEKEDLQRKLNAANEKIISLLEGK